MDEKILFVDDEANALAGYERTLHREFFVSTATGGQQGLAAIETNGPFAVVVSDMCMSGMNGAEFLAQVRLKSPDTVRMLLTGYSDLYAAIRAVNEGKIFGYLTTPCEKQALVEAIKNCIEQYRTRSNEKALLKKARLMPHSNAEGQVAEDTEDADCETPTGLPGRYLAIPHLNSVCGTDPQSFVILSKLPLFSAVEQRHGMRAANDYLSKEAQYLIETLSPDDWIYQWTRDTFLAVVRRKISPSVVGEAISRLVAKKREHVLIIDEQRTTIAGKMTFDLLPAVEFPGIDELFEAFADREIGSCEK